MAAAVPIAKLGFLLIRTVAKPFAGRLKDFLKDHDTARKAFGSLGQMLHKMEVRVAGNEQYLKVDKNGKSGVLQGKVKPLEEGKAVSNGADFFAESIIFLIAGICLTIEVRSSNKKDEQKKAALEKRFFEAEDSVQKTMIHVDSLKKELQRARQHTISLHSDVIALMQSRTFTDGEIEAAEKRLQDWVSSFKDEDSRRDSLLQLVPPPKPLHDSSSFLEKLESFVGSFKDAPPSSAHRPKLENEKPDSPKDVGESEMEVVLRQLEANKKASIALRKSKAKKRAENAKDDTSPVTSLQSSSAAAMSPSEAGDRAPVTSDAANTSIAAQLSSRELCSAAAPSAPDSNVDWRKVTFSSIVLGVVISFMATR